MYYMGSCVFRSIAILGLLLISIGTGGIKPCVLTFGDEQFRLPQQQEQLQRYVTKFMLVTGIGELVSTILTPVLRQNLHCFGRSTCYPLAFGLPAALMFAALGMTRSDLSRYEHLCRARFACTVLSSIAVDGIVT